jgi:hypothetical protein
MKTTRIRSHVTAGLFALATLFLPLPRTAAALTCADQSFSDQGKFCSATAEALFCGCGSEARSDYFVARAVCANEPESGDRAQCFSDAQDTRSEDEALCSDQRQGRLDACDLLGEGRYDPQFEPKLFDANFVTPIHPNPYFPLKVGNKWEYRSATETNTVEILNRTKLIDDVNCVVGRDLVYEDGVLKEVTDDWFAQAKTGDVWYCGEEVKNYETFEGDKPQAPELVSVDGRFKAGIDGADPGIIFLKSPVKGDAYLEEFSLANAEDIAIVRSTSYSYGKDPVLDKGVPKALAQKLCSAGDCIVTDNISLLEPGIVEHKYYAKGIGTFLETGPGGEVVRLVSCNVDPRCSSLPQP